MTPERPLTPVERWFWICVLEIAAFIWDYPILAMALSVLLSTIGALLLKGLLT